MYEVTRDTVREEVMVAVRDTIREVTTITVDRNDRGDTLKVVQVTDRDRIRSKADVRSKKEVVRVERDTVYVAVRDSVQVTTTNLSNPTNKSSNFVRSLKWICCIICASVVLIIVIRIGLTFGFPPSRKA